MGAKPRVALTIDQVVTRAAKSEIRRIAAQKARSQVQHVLDPIVKKIVCTVAHEPEIAAQIEREVRAQLSVSLEDLQVTVRYRPRFRRSMFKRDQKFTKRRSR